MAKIKGPLFSLGAHGSLSKTLSYSRRRSGDQCRRYNKPTVPATPAQHAQRRLTEFLVAHWQNMSAGDRATWEANAKASGLNLSGYHYFLRTAQRDLYTHHGLCGYWHCNKIIGGKVLDLSGNGNHGTLQPDYPSNAPTLVNSRTLKMGKALSYDGINEHVNCGSNKILEITGALTIEALIYPVNIETTHRNILAKTTNESYRIRIEYDTKKLLMLINDGGWTAVRSTKAISENAWSLVEGVFVPTEQKIYFYINGKLDSSPDIGKSSIQQNAGDLLIGEYGTIGESFSGIMDEVCLYNRTLSAAEIATRYKFAIRPV